MQLQTYVCDCCGHEVRKNTQPEGWIQLRSEAHIVPGKFTLDLCSSCHGELEKLIEGGRNVKGR